MCNFHCACAVCCRANAFQRLCNAVPTVKTVFKVIFGVNPGRPNIRHADSVSGNVNPRPYLPSSYCAAGRSTQAPLKMAQIVPVLKNVATSKESNIISHCYCNNNMNSRKSRENNTKSNTQKTWLNLNIIKLTITTTRTLNCTMDHDIFQCRRERM